MDNIAAETKPSHICFTNLLAINNFPVNYHLIYSARKLWCNEYGFKACLCAANALNVLEF